MCNILAVEVNDFEETWTKCPLETLVMLSVQQYLTDTSHEEKENIPNLIDVGLVLRKGKGMIKLPANFSSKSENNQIEDSLPWSDCRLPAIECENGAVLVSAGMCAVARRLVTAASPRILPPHHPDGLLGFRSSCLQAPSETSVWTKFCECEMIDTTSEFISEALSGKQFSKFSIPETLVKFENHLKQPLCVHNVYKLAREMSKINVKNELEETNIVLDSTENKRERSKVKNRKWKSKSNVIIESSTPIDELNLRHDFAEGPSLTIADVILYTCYYIFFHFLKSNEIKDHHLPNTFKWFKKLQLLSDFNSVNSFLNNVILLTFENFTYFTDEATFTLPNIPNFSLYKCDPSRNKKRYFTKDEDIKNALEFVNDDLEMDYSDIDCSLKIDWANIPDAANPFGGHLPDDRVLRKTQQLENLAIAVMNIAKKGDRIVDFCSGGGHLGILLAYLLPTCSIVLLENKENSLKRAEVRVRALNLNNVSFIQCNLDFFIGNFDIGVALHACGISTDLVLENCIKRKAAFAICPCCYGFIHETNRLQYPRSTAFKNVPLDSYMCIGHSADQTHIDHPMEQRGIKCMKIIDSDRAKYASSNGYSVILCQLKPRTCTPKNNLIIGTHKE